METNKKGDPRNLIIIILAVIAIAAVAVAIWAVMGRKSVAQESESETQATGFESSEETEEKLTDTIALPQFAWLDLVADTTNQTLTFDNPARNFAFFRVRLVLDDDTLWESDLLAPGETSEPMMLNKPLKKGEYEAHLVYTCYSDREEQNALNGADSPITVKVE